MNIPEAAQDTFDEVVATVIDEVVPKSKILAHEWVDQLVRDIFKFVCLDPEMRPNLSDVLDICGTHSDESAGA